MTTQLARLACVGFACLVTTSHAASSWHQFRGSNCSGVSPDGNPPVVFGPKTNLVFKVAVPGGASSPCVAEDKVFLTAAEGQSLQTICYDAKSGALLWRAEAPGGTIENHHPTEGSPAASTPAVAGGQGLFIGSQKMLKEKA